ncbi:hypothetical protein MNB_SUP05-SYMBIONT-5-461 [hydrothermal vent metagenome]|uniref:Uncharacterized protein n=1 Tax=hydrothermal vent metagenome TaxID=652676 RepID=A0A1W1E2L3_9ZZZZ
MEEMNYRELFILLSLLVLSVWAYFALQSWSKKTLKSNNHKNSTHSHQ